MSYRWFMTVPTPAESSARGRAALMASLAVVAVVIASALVVFRLSGPTSPPLTAPVDPRYPDMGMAPLSSILVGQEDSGRSFLRFSATLVNVGPGPAMDPWWRRGIS